MLVLGGASAGEGGAAPFGCVGELGPAVAGGSRVSRVTTAPSGGFVDECGGDWVRGLHVQPGFLHLNTPKQIVMNWRTSVDTPTPKALFSLEDKPSDRG